ncbi:MAG: hypothetical protein ACLFOC_09990 [Campylobacterales bacterium]
MKDLTLEMSILKIASKAVKEAQRKSLENGVANVYSKNGQIYFQLPDGTITQETPKEYKSEKKVDFRNHIAHECLGKLK